VIVKGLCGASVGQSSEQGVGSIGRKLRILLVSVAEKDIFGANKQVGRG